MGREGRGLHEGLHVGVPGDLLDGEEGAGLAVGAEEGGGEHGEAARSAPQEHLGGAHPPLQGGRHAPARAVVAHRDIAGAHPVACASALPHGSF